MRLHFPNMTRPKAAASTLARILPGTALSRAQAAVATCCGYRDWHELERSHAGAPAPADPTGPALRGAAVAATLSLAKSLGVHDGVAQYALSASRLLSASEWPFEDHLAVRTACLLRTGGLAGHRVVEVVPEWGGVAYAPDTGGPRVYTDRGQAAYSSEARPRDPAAPLPDFVPPRLYLPYGRWSMADGSEILFSRDYNPLWRLAGGRPERLESRGWVDGIVEQETFWVPASDPYRDPGLMRAQHERMASFGIRGLPALVDRYATLLEQMRVPQGVHYAHPQPGFPYGPPILSYRGDDGGASRGLPPGYYVTYGGKRPWGEVPEGLA